MKARGPDLQKTKLETNKMLVQSVLNFTGNIDFYQQTVDDGFLFNGEIYKFKKDFANDTEQIYDIVTKKSWYKFKSISGPWAWVYDDSEDVWAATDPQWEKHLFQFIDAEHFIISSEIDNILEITKPKLELANYSSKHYPIIEHTPYKNIKRLKPGWLYKNGRPIYCLDDMSTWIDNTWQETNQNPIDYLDQLLVTTINQMTPKENYSVTVSGGIDSSLISSYLPMARKITVATDRDPIASSVITDARIILDEKTWAEEFIQTQIDMKLPVLSWSLVGYRSILNNMQDRVLFTGVGADEIFGGYEHYYKFLPSPYVCNESQSFDLDKITHQYRDKFLCDLIVQFGSVDGIGIDLLSGKASKEVRNPFVHKNIISFAQSLDYNTRVGAKGKQILRDLYKNRLGYQYEQDKLGFTAICNESIKYIDQQYKSINNRSQDWRNFILNNFRKYYESCN